MQYLLSSVSSVGVSVGVREVAQLSCSTVTKSAKVDEGPYNHICMCHGIPLLLSTLFIGALQL